MSISEAYFCVASLTPTNAHCRVKFQIRVERLSNDDYNNEGAEPSESSARRPPSAIGRFTHGNRRACRVWWISTSAIINDIVDSAFRAETAEYYNNISHWQEGNEAKIMLADFDSVDTQSRAKIRAPGMKHGDGFNRQRQMALLLPAALASASIYDVIGTSRHACFDSLVIRGCRRLASSPKAAQTQITVGQVDASANEVRPWRFTIASLVDNLPVVDMGQCRIALLS